VQLQRDIRAVDAHTCRESFEAAQLNIFCPTPTLSHEFINISASVRVKVLYSGVVTGMHDCRKSGRKQDWE
jgi:hypothetical protein